ncbi:MAG: hypothetical protein D3906_12920 [Candidatus Electrothrix sp. AUS1_2]|nr:hypothetical protein [Candidatus Electrothrix sp. AUS1_2]
MILPGTDTADFKNEARKAKSREQAKGQKTEKSGGILDALQSAASITPREIKWLWNPVLAVGKFHLLAARGGSGKTSIACDLAARVTTGGLFPMSETERFPPGAVLFVTTEDDPEDTLLPRFLAAGGNLEKLSFLPSSAHHLDLNARPDELETLVSSIPGLSLVVLDPVTSMTGDANTHIDSNVKRLAGVLSGIAMNSGLAILGIIHFRKGDPKAQGQNLIDMVTGSAGWVNSARIALACSVDDKSGSGYFGVIKSNIGPKDYTLEYRTAVNNGVVCVEYLDMQQNSIERIFRQDAAREKRNVKEEKLNRATNRYGEFFTEHGLEPALQSDVRKYVKEMLGERITDSELRDVERRHGYTSKPGGKGGNWLMHPPGCKCEKCSSKA